MTAPRLLLVTAALNGHRPPEVTQRNQSDDAERRSLPYRVAPQEQDCDEGAQVVEGARSGAPGFVRGGCENHLVTVALSEPVAEMSDCLDSVRGMLSGLDDRGIIAALRDIESLSRRVHAVMLDLVAEADSRGIATGQSFGTTARLVAEALGLSAAEARMRVKHATMVGARRTITGQPLAPQLPATAAALAAGEIGIGQLRVITETMAALPASVPVTARERAEADLAGYARDFDPRRLRLIAHRILANLDPDGVQPGEEASEATPVRGELWLRIAVTAAWG